MDGKPCTHCRVGWMTAWLSRIGSNVYRVWLCDACGHQEAERLP